MAERKHRLVDCNPHWVVYSGKEGDSPDAIYFDCPEGGCNVSANSAGAVTLDCPGGGCVLACAGSTSCKITGCPDCICSDDSSASGVCGL